MQTTTETTLIPCHEQQNAGSSLSGSDAIALLEVISACMSCRNQDDFSALFHKIRDFLPFDNSISVLGHLESDQVVTVHDVNISFPTDWFREYMSHNYLRMSAVIKRNFAEYELQNWTEAWKRLHQPEEIISLCRDFGMGEGYTHGSRPLAAENYGSMFCFSGPSIRCDRRTEAILENLVPHLHLALSRVFSNQARVKAASIISKREKEVLSWLKQGKSSWEISVILCISERTVNFHVYNIMRKLGTSNRPQTVAVAANLGLIDIT